MTTDIYANKRVTVMGLGFHHGGENVARFFVEHGAAVTVTDLQPAEKLPEALTALSGLPIRFVLGHHEEEDFIKADLVIRNPGVPHTSQFLQIAKDHRVPIQMESDLFFELSPSRSIIAVTGTKGKSTTAHCIAHVLQSSGKRVHMMGNMGKGMLEELADINSDDSVVLELSSYQCEGFGYHLSDFVQNGTGPQYAVITNLYPDHLNRYKSMEEYAWAKKQLLLSQNQNQVCLLNKENEWSQFFSKDILSKVLWYEQETLPENVNLKLLGKHNRLNAGAVYLLAQQAGIDVPAIIQALESFPGVEHRLEYVRTLNGVDFYNDTTATNPDAAVAGLQTILELDRKTVLIVGGNDKGMDYTQLVSLINNNHIPVVLLSGTADEKLSQIDKELQKGKYTNFEEAIIRAYEIVRDDGIVLLSPGATSFNIFRDEFDRGRQFKNIVKELK